MTQIEIVGTVALGLGSIIGLVVAITTPFSKLSRSITGLEGTVKLLHETVKDFKEMFKEQKVTNEKFYKKIAKIERDILDVQHNCQLVHKQYYKDKS
jgi:uncharacterized membrane protein (DUF106 family)